MLHQNNQIRKGVNPVSGNWIRVRNSTPESNRSDQRNNSLNESFNIENDMNLNVFDFIPNEQDSTFFRQLLGVESTRTCFSVQRICFILFIIIVLTVSALCAYFSLENFTPNDLSIIRHHTCLQNNKRQLNELITKIGHLNKKFQSLSISLNDVIQWRNQVAIKGMANTTLKNNYYKLLQQMDFEIEKALNLYDADKIGMIDYALESAGGFITSIPDTIPYPNKYSFTLLGLISLPYSSNPRVMIQPGTLPGECFGFQGTNGRIRIRLAYQIDIIAVTIEHTHPKLVTDLTSAPKDFKVYGLENPDSEEKIALGSFRYQLDKKPLQTFDVIKLNEEHYVYQHVELHILTNYGNPNYTCVYRFRVHGNK